MYSLNLESSIITLSIYFIWSVHFFAWESDLDYFKKSGTFDDVFSMKSVLSIANQNTSRVPSGSHEHRLVNLANFHELYDQAVTS